MSSDDHSSWDRQYLGTPPAWDIGRPQPAFVRLQIRALSGRVLDVGCGTGETRSWPQSMGRTPWELTFPGWRSRWHGPRANERGVTTRFAVADCLDLGALGEVFDVVVDSGLFHVFDDDQRPRYASSLASVVRDGGIVDLTCLSDQQSGDWGTRRVSRAEIEETFRDGWVIDDLATCVREINRPEVAPGQQRPGWRRSATCISRTLGQPRSERHVALVRGQRIELHVRHGDRREADAQRHFLGVQQHVGFGERFVDGDSAAPVGVPSSTPRGTLTGS